MNLFSGSPQPAQASQPPAIRTSTDTIALLLLLVIVQAGLVISGCGGPRTTSSIDAVEVRRYRWYVDDVKTKVWVVGELQNTGEVTVEGVDVHVTLHDSHGSVTGTNTVVEEDLKAGESCVFHIGVTRQGGTATVTVELKQPRNCPDRPARPTTDTSQTNTQLASATLGAAIPLD